MSGDRQNRAVEAARNAYRNAERVFDALDDAISGAANARARGGARAARIHFGEFIRGLVNTLGSADFGLRAAGTPFPGEEPTLHNGIAWAVVDELGPVKIELEGLMKK